MDKPTQIVKDGKTLNFTYGPQHMRFKQVNGSVTTFYSDKLYEEEIDGTNTTWRAYIDDIAVISQTTNEGAAIRYTHRDRLVSARVFTDHNAQVEAERNYDPFGKPRLASGGLKNPAKQDDLEDTKTRRGFTDHEHLDNVELIHMNGRVYDYNLGRFLSVDPLIQGVGNSQGVNPYSYIMNNPLSGTDPTGYEIEEFDETVRVSMIGSRIKRTVAVSTDSTQNGEATVSISGGNGAVRAVVKNRLTNTLTKSGYNVANVGAPQTLSKGADGNGTTKNQSSNMTIEGFDNDRYNKHDDLITSIADEINADKAGVIGATDEQAAGIGDVDPRLVKAWMIQESGGNDSGSKSAWDVDPLQANAYKRDWDKHKSGLGLKKSEAGAGDLKTNIRAGVVMMIRKGFGKSGQPPVNRPSGTFDGYKTALRRYNGRTGSTTNGNLYSVNYANRIMRGYGSTANRVAISLPRPL